MEADAITYEAEKTNASTAVNAAAEVKVIGWLSTLITAALSLLPMKKVKALFEVFEECHFIGAKTSGGKV